MAREFIVPGRIMTGKGALDMAGEALKSMGKKAMIVTGPMMVELGNCEILTAVLKKQGIESVIDSEITGEPTDLMIEEGLRLYLESGCDFLIALGGGSPIDSMKAIGFLTAGKGALSDYMGRGIDVKVPPMAAIPTTAGTGSEVTQFTIITDTRKDIKMLLKGRALIPGLAIVDPRFTMTAPQKVTASTGLDALCHAVEAYTSRNAQTLSDTFALSAVRRIFSSLPAAYHDGLDEKARTSMSVAALEAGIAFNNSSVTLIHGMSRPIGALFHVAHGLSNAMLLNPCLSFALAGVISRFAILGRTVGAASEKDTDEEAGRKFLASVAGLCEELQIPTLAEYGIGKKAFMSAVDKMAGDAMDSGSPQNTMREVTINDVKAIYKTLWQ